MRQHKEQKQDTGLEVTRHVDNTWLLENKQLVNRFRMCPLQTRRLGLFEVLTTLDDLLKAWRLGFGEVLDTKARWVWNQKGNRHPGEQLMFIYNSFCTTFGSMWHMLMCSHLSSRYLGYFQCHLSTAYTQHLCSIHVKLEDWNVWCKLIDLGNKQRERGNWTTPCSSAKGFPSDSLYPSMKSKEILRQSKLSDQLLGFCRMSKP